MAFPEKITYNDKYNLRPIVEPDGQFSAENANELKNKLNKNALFYDVHDNLAALQAAFPNPPKGAFAYLIDGSHYRCVNIGWVNKEKTATQIVSAIDAEIGNPDWKTQKTEEQIQDIIAAMFQIGTQTNCTVAYDDATGALSITANAGGGATLTDEQVQDIVGAFQASGTGINVGYDDVANAMTFSLSGESFTTAYRNKLDGIAAGATANSTDANLRDRTTHTGTQAASTIVESTTKRFASDAEKAAWNAKQDLLVGEVKTGLIELNNIAGKIYGDTAALTGNLTIDDTKTVIGGTAVVYHNDSAAPTITTSLEKIPFGTYTLNARNLIAISKIGSGKLGLVYKALTAAADTQAPTPPTIITATNVGTNSYDLTWSGETDNVGVTGFRISDNGNLIDVASSPYTVNPSSLNAGAVGTIQILAKDAAGNESNFSAPIDVYMKFQLTGITATPNTDPTKMDLAWNFVNASVNIDNYIIERSTDNATWGVIATLTNASLTYQDTALADATLYYYRIRATDNEALHASSEWVSDSATTGTPLDTTAPTVPTSLSSPTKTETTVDLTWIASTDAVGVTGYKIYKGGIFNKQVATNSGQVTGLVASTSYSFTVSAIDAEGNESAQSVALVLSTSAAAPATVESTLQATGEWYDFTDKSVGAFAPFIGKKGNYTTALVGGTPEYVAGTKLKTLRAENDVIDLGSTFAHLKNAVDGISMYMKFAPTEVGYTTYFLGETDGNNQIIIGLNASGQMYMLSKMGSATLVINTTTNSLWSGAGPYAVKNIFIEIVKSTGAVNFYDGTTLLAVGTPASAGDISLYNPTYRWYLGARNNVGTTDVANDISAEFEHIIINPKLLTATEKQFIIDNV